MYKNYANYQRDEIYRIENGDESGSIFTYIIVFLIIGGIAGLIIYFLTNPNIRIRMGWRGFNSTGHNHTHHIDCTPRPSCNLNVAQTVGVYAEQSIFNEGGSTTINGDAVILSNVGILGNPPANVTGNIYINPANITADISNYTRCITSVRCIHYDHNFNFFSKPIEPGVYCGHSHSTIIGNWNIVLDGKNRTNPVWIFILEFSAVMNAHSKVTVVNTDYGYNNVWYFKHGYVYVERDSLFQGNIIAKGNVVIGKNSIVTGKVISLDGNVATFNSSINTNGIFGPRNCSQISQ